MTRSRTITSLGLGLIGLLASLGVIGEVPLAGQNAPAVPFATFTTNVILALAYSNDGNLVAGGSLDKSVKIWDAKSGTLLQTLEGSPKIVRAVIFLKDNTTVIAGGDDGGIRLWNARSGRLKRTLSGHDGWLRSLAISQDGKTLASAGRHTPDAGKTWTDEVKLWDVETGREKKTLKEDVFTLAFAPDGKTLASAKTVVNLWDVESGKLRQTLKPKRGGVSLVAFSPDGKMLAAGGGYAKKVEFGTIPIPEVHLWDVRTGKLQQTLTKFRPGGLGLRSLAFSPNGRMLATGTDGPVKTRQGIIGGSSELKLWDPRKDEPLRTIERDGIRIDALAFSPDGETLVLCDGEIVDLINTQTGERKHCLMKVIPTTN